MHCTHGHDCACPRDWPAYEERPRYSAFSQPPHQYMERLMRTQNNWVRTEESRHDFILAILHLVVVLIAHLLRRSPHGATTPPCLDARDNAMHDEAYRDMRKLQTQLFKDMMKVQQELYEDFMRMKREQVTAEDYSEINERMRNYFNNSNNNNKDNTL